MPKNGDTRVKDGHLETYYAPPGKWERTGRVRDRGQEALDEAEAQDRAESATETRARGTAEAKDKAESATEAEAEAATEA